MTRRTDFRPVSPRAAAIAVLFSLLTAVALVMPAFAFFQDDRRMTRNRSRSLECSP